MADPTPTKPRRLWRVIFAISLALNLAVVGIVIGFSIRQDGRPVPRAFELAVGPIGRALSSEDRRFIGASLRRNPELRHGGRAETRQITEDLIAVLRTTPFSQDALEDIVERANARADRIKDAARVALVQRIMQMTDAERAALADRIAAMGERRR